MDTSVSIPKSDLYTYNINNNFYTFQVTLISINGPTETKGQDIKPSAIKSLVIEDSFKNFFHKGYIIIDNSYDVIERDVDNTLDPSSPQYYNNVGQAGSGNLGFLFRGEARDILRIDIMPRLDESNFDSQGDINTQAVFRMVYDFAVYNSEEIAGSEPSQKYKKLFFWDLYYQLMTEKNTSFSTSNYLNVQDINQLDDIERGIPTGLAALALIKEAFPDGSEYPANISYRDSKGFTTQTITDVNATIANYNPETYQNINWDIGGGNIFFSTPTKFKAIDSLNYILSRHVSNIGSNYDQCFLRLERYPREFSLKSLRQYFNQAYDNNNDIPGNYYLETIKIGGYDQGDGKDFYGHAFTPAGGLYFERIGTVKSFSFDNMPGLYSQQELVSRFVHSYNYDNKQFNIDALANSVEEAMKAYKDSYVDCLISSNEYPSYPNFAPGQYRDKNINIDNVFTVINDDPNKRLAVGRNRFLYASVMTNNLISFRLPGSTHRQAGRFIGIDRDGAMVTSKFDDKLLGIYFIVEVKHHFNDGEYYNDLHCIKTYNFYKQENTDSTGLISNSI